MSSADQDERGLALDRAQEGADAPKVQVWMIVTGASRGLGLALTREALATGHRVLATSRSGSIDLDLEPEEQQRLVVWRLDVAETKDALYDALVDAALENFGRIDVLLNNAGFGDLTAFGEADDTEIERTFQTNLLGLMRMTRAVLPIMRNQRSGRILNITSSTGNDGRGPALYHTSKAASAAFTEALSFEVGAFGIRLTNVAAGLFRMDFLDRSSMTNASAHALAAYDEHRAMLARFTEGMSHQQAGDPDRLASLVVEVAAADSPPLHLVVGADPIATLERHQCDVTADVEAWRQKSIATAFEPSEIHVAASSFFNQTSA